MSGHSKWATIKHKKGLADAKRGQKFTKLIKEITVAAKMGGSDPDSNARLRTAVLKARAENMPKDNIERAIKKASGEDANTTFYELTYEGYAPGGVAIIIDTLTDNKNRTAADVRSTLTKLGGSLGATGCVSYMFQTKGVITYDGTKYTEDQIFEAALENGAEDVSAEDGVIEVTTSPADFASVLEAMQAAGLVSGLLNSAPGFSGSFCAWRLTVCSFCGRSFSLSVMSSLSSVSPTPAVPHHLPGLPSGSSAYRGTNSSSFTGLKSSFTKEYLSGTRVMT